MKITIRVAVAGTALMAAAMLAGCEETRLVGVKTQVDTFVQEGDEVIDLFTQDTGQQVDTFTQTGFHQVDTFKQKAAAEVDILFVVDNSDSMGEEQERLGKNFGRFMTYIDESLIDYHIGVISTDMDESRNPGHCGRLQGNPKVIDRSTPDRQAVFEANVKVGVDGGGNEMGLLAAHHALSEPLVSTENSGFLRPGASLAAIFVSDEDDNSYGGLAFYTRFFSSIKEIGNENNVIITAIVAPDPIPPTCDAYSPGQRYIDLVHELGGTEASICDVDFGATLEQLGLTVAGLSRKFILSREPDPDTVVVSVDPDGNGFLEIPELNPAGESNWQVELGENALYFYAYVPPPQADIKVEYSNVDDIFRLTGRGDASTIVVKVDGTDVPQGDNCWQYHYDENAVIFYNECIPALDSTVEIAYSSLENVFILSQPVSDPDTLRVWLDSGGGFAEIFEDPATGWIFHAETNSVRFQGSTVPSLGAQLKVVYSNLVSLFTLSRLPVEDTLKVALDPDGSGSEPSAPVPRQEESAGAPGWIYYGPDEAAPYTNSISFEMFDPLPPYGSVITVTYTPGE